MDEYFAMSDNQNKKVYVIIYDIVSDKIRYRLAKILAQYGFRIQRSAFELILSRKDEQDLVREIETLSFDENDLIRMYRLCGNDKILSFGNIGRTFEEEVVIL